MFDPERRFGVWLRMVENFIYGGDEARVNKIKYVDMLIEGLRGWFEVVFCGYNNKNLLSTRRGVE